MHMSNIVSSSNGQGNMTPSIIYREAISYSYISRWYFTVSTLLKHKRRILVWVSYSPIDILNMLVLVTYKHQNKINNQKNRTATECFLIPWNLTISSIKRNPIVLRWDLNTPWPIGFLSGSINVCLDIVRWLHFMIQYLSLSCSWCQYVWFFHNIWDLLCKQ